MLNTKKVYAIRNSKGETEDWYSSEKIAKFMAKSDETVEQRTAIVDVFSDREDSMLVDKHCRIIVTLKTHDKEALRKYRAYMKTLRESAIAKIQDKLSEDELEALGCLD